MVLKGPIYFTKFVSANSTSHHLLGARAKQRSVDSVSTSIN